MIFKFTLQAESKKFDITTPTYQERCGYNPFSQYEGVDVLYRKDNSYLRINGWLPLTPPAGFVFVGKVINCIGV